MDLPGDLPALPLVLLLGTVRGDGGRGRGSISGDGLRLGAERQDERQDDSGDDHRDDHEPGAGSSALGSLLRHEPLVPRGAAARHPGWLSWISYNRVWLIPYVSAVLVVAIEVLAGLFAEKPIPPQGHVALGWFGLWAVGRGAKRRETLRQRERKISTVARQLGIPENDLQDEFAAFMAWRDTPEEGGDA